MKNIDRACPVAEVACFDRHLTESLINIFNLNKVLNHWYLDKTTSCLTWNRFAVYRGKLQKNINYDKERFTNLSIYIVGKHTRK